MSPSEDASEVNDECKTQVKNDRRPESQKWGINEVQANIRCGYIQFIAKFGTDTKRMLFKKKLYLPHIIANLSALIDQTLILRSGIT